ncbi:hypothetical protein SKAU_G00294400 [Synaphobranchus kaupii]|uniref:Uroplakin-2 n=1 Tax=Synaphobranchus kaupii TaxID=118154 RepID=A0A9Q1EUE2_SYNKA|nr:hypothetical protein SKAU_G00294400 [Synaphobranchus kaupii]
MKNIILIVFGMFFTIANAKFKLKLLEPSDGVLSSKFSYSLILSLPPCSLVGKNVDLAYNNTGTSESKALKSIFQVPNCRSKRDLISVTEKNNHFTLTKDLGYQVNNLINGTQYSFQYVVDTEESNILTASTRAALSYTQIDDGLPARSAAMVVITVLLSVAMFILLVGLIISLFYGNSGD